jgi:hypothetical protein
MFFDSRPLLSTQLPPIIIDKSVILNSHSCVVHRLRNAKTMFVPLREQPRLKAMPLRIPTQPNRLTVRLTNQPQVHATWGHKQQTLLNQPLWIPQGSIRVRASCSSILHLTPATKAML